MSERNTPTSMAGAITLRALFALSRPATAKWLRIIRNQGHRRRRQWVNPTCNSRAQPTIAISRVSVECGVERGRTLRGVRPFPLAAGAQGTQTADLGSFWLPVGTPYFSR